MTAAARTLDEIAEIVGEDAAALLMAAFAGRQIYVPRQCGPDHPIAAAIGVPAANLLCDYYHGVRLEIPVGQQRRQDVLDLHRCGMSNRVIARRLRCSERFVRKVLAERGRPSHRHQPDLFESDAGMGAGQQ